MVFSCCYMFRWPRPDTTDWHRVNWPLTGVNVSYHMISDSVGVHLGGDNFEKTTFYKLYSFQTVMVMEIKKGWVGGKKEILPTSARFALCKVVWRTEIREGQNERWPFYLHKQGIVCIVRVGGEVAEVESFSQIMRRSLRLPYICQTVSLNQSSLVSWTKAERRWIQLTNHTAHVSPLWVLINAAFSDRRASYPISFKGRLWGNGHCKWLDEEEERSWKSGRLGPWSSNNTFTFICFLSAAFAFQIVILFPDSWGNWST